MKKRTVLFLSLMAGVMAMTIFSHSVFAFEIGARGYYWFPTLKGNLRVDGATLQGTEFNLQDDLALGKEAYPSIEVFGGARRHHLSLMYTQVRYAESTSLAKQIIFNGTTFPVNTVVDSSFKIKMLDLAYQYDIINLRNVLAGFSVGAIGKIKYIEGDMNISSSPLGTSQLLRVPIPMLGLGGRMGILADILSVRAELSGSTYNGNYCYEGLADISLRPYPFVDIHGGYKIIKIHVDHKDVYLDSETAGPFAALTVSF